MYSADTRTTQALREHRAAQLHRAARSPRPSRLAARIREVLNGRQEPVTDARMPAPADQPVA